MAIERYAILAGAGLLAAGCTLGPDFNTPSSFSPASWFASRKPPAASVSRTVQEPLDPNWWTLLHDDELTKLEGQLATGNFNVRLAGLRLAESRAQRGVTAASQFPNLNGNASYTREEISQRGVLGLIGGSGAGGGAGAGASASGPQAQSSNGAGMGTNANGLTGRSGGIPSSQRIPPFNLFQYGFDASWELDLWGRVRRQVESADATLEQSSEQRRDMLVTASAELARDYVQLRGQQRDLEIAQANLKSEQDTLTLTKQRAAGGLTTDLDVANAAVQVATTQATIPQLQQQAAQTMNAIALLLGETPGALSAELGAAKPIPPVPPVVPIGLPSELVRRRPDIRAAEANLHSATADIGVAEADFFPKVTLSGSIGIQATRFKDLGNWGSREYSGGPSISLPIFQGGQLRYTLELRRAQQQEAATQYQQTVLQAFHDVDNALTAYGAEQQRRDALATAVQQAQRAQDLAQSQYRQGLATFLDVLNAQRSVLQAQQQYADSTTTLSTNLVQLYKALGGGWEGAFPRGAPDEKATRLFGG